MDSERQPLLQGCSDFRCIRSRPLTYEEVLTARQEIFWTRTRFCLILMFWAIMAMFLSIVTCLLITAPRCTPYDVGLAMMPSVPPVHMTFAPLIASGRAANPDYTYTM